MKMKDWKVIGFLATIAAAGLSLITHYVEDKKLEQTIEEKVDKALSEREKEEESA